METIAFITTRIDTFSNPTLIILFEKLIEKNYNILFFGFDQMFIPREIRKKLIFCELPFNHYEFKRSSKNIIKQTKQYLRLYKILKLKFKVKKIICIDPFGIVIGGRIKKLINFKLIYFSFEIFFEDEFIVDRKKIIKKLEIKYSENVDLLVIQDPAREKLLREVSNFNERMKVIHIPVSPRPMNYELKNYDIFEEHKIPEDKIIIIYSGSLMEWSGIYKLLNTLPVKPESEYWLILHSHHKLSNETELKIKITELINKNYNITIHDKPFYDYKDYYAFLVNCNIGITTYYPNTTDVFAGKNIEEIGLSSGKFSTYMMLGIPTITTPNAVYKELNGKYNFGEIINTMEESDEAIRKISKDYKIKSEGCKKLYEEVLNPLTGFGKLMNYLKEE